jgi:acetyl-CoA carboxylase biotin carboxyl carrier protein
VNGVSPEDLEAFVQLFEASDWDQADLVIGDVKLHLSKTASASASAWIDPAARGVASEVSLFAVSDPGRAAPTHDSRSAMPSNWVEIVAPHVGTFYRAPKTGTAPYVEIGQAVIADTEVCLLEVMRQFTTLRAGTTGVIRRICAADGVLVEGGEALYIVESAGESG